MRRALFGLLLFSACEAPEPTGTPGFIALDRDFASYPQWESVSLDGGAIESHTEGVRRVFLNARPDAGLEAWPVGTILVKELPFAIFAMVKRGGGYNAQGAAGWEWFELFNDTPTSVSIKWRGLGPPLGESYSATGQTCNDCHAGQVANDSVMTGSFQLAGP